jgi:hypothetical protein
MKTRRLLHRTLRDSSGQGLLEFALVLPLVLTLTLGIVEVSYALFDQHIVTKLTREGANLISRNTSLADALGALKTMSTGPVNFDTGSRVILSVIRKGQTAGTANVGKDVLYQRFEYGAIPGSSTLKTLGTGSFGSGPDFQAANSDTDARLQVTNLPANLVPPGGMLYVAEVYTTHTLITPFDRFGTVIPNVLYSIAYF